MAGNTPNQPTGAPAGAGGAQAASVTQPDVPGPTPVQPGAGIPAPADTARAAAEREAAGRKDADRLAFDITRVQAVDNRLEIQLDWRAELADGSWHQLPADQITVYQNEQGYIAPRDVLLAIKDRAETYIKPVHVDKASVVMESVGDLVGKSATLGAVYTALDADRSLA